MDRKILREKLHNFSNFFSALSNPWRIYILFSLYKNGNLSVKEISDLTGYSQPFVSQSLQKLKAEKIVSCERVGQKVYYTLSNSEILRNIFHCIEKEIN